MIRVAVFGAMGRMGQEVVKTVLATPDLQLTGALDRQHVGMDLGTALNLGQPLELLISSDPATALLDADVCVDFTHPDTVYSNTMTLIEAGVRPVIGTTGLSDTQLTEIGRALAARQLGGAVIPNFAIGAVLMMKFAREAARYFESAEIIELHHNQKADAPSGTALKTAQLMAESREKFTNSLVPETECIAGARGAKGPAEIHIHSVRLPGLVAHQEVLLAGPGQLLSLRHDSFDRTCFMPGVVVAIRGVMERTGLIYGLENLL
jgi:4-hydroxy-tetrahydrodipicolinate reductase